MFFSDCLNAVATIWMSVWLRGRKRSQSVRSLWTSIVTTGKEISAKEVSSRTPDWMAASAGKYSGSYWMTYLL